MNHTSLNNHQVLVRFFFLFFLIFFLPGSERSYAVHSYPAEIGWSFHLTTPSDWQKNEGEGTLTQYPDHLSAFLVSQTTCVWTLTSEPIWVYRFPEVHISYRARGIQNSALRPVFQFHSGSTGPVTPGAQNIENPLARSGIATALLSKDLICDGELHSLTVQIRPPIQTEQIDQIILTLQTGDQAGMFEIHELSFVDPNASTNNQIHVSKTISPAKNISQKKSYRFLQIQESSCLSNELSKDNIFSNQTVQCSGIPFRFNVSKSLMTTNFIKRDSLEVNVNAHTSGIFLLMAAYFVGTDGAFRFVPRTSVTQPERLIVSKMYEDGSIERSFPFHIGKRSYIVDATMNAYAIPTDPEKKLLSVRVEEFMPYAQLYLAAATLEKASTPLYPIPPENFPVSFPRPDTKSVTGKPTLTVKDDHQFTFENPLYKLVFETKQGPSIEFLALNDKGKNILRHTSPLFSLTVGGSRIPSEHWQLQSYKTKLNTLELVFLTEKEPFSLETVFRVTAKETNACAMTLQITNRDYTPQTVRLRFPNVKNLQISNNGEEDYYFFPRSPIAWGNTPVQLSGVHSGEFPLQFMDSYSSSGKGGLAIHTRDTELVLKRYSLQKTDLETDMGIEYGFFQPIELDSRESFITPETVFEFHKGDWHVPFENYKKWLSSWYPSRTETRNILKNVFICRRDYPIGGTGYLFDEIHDSYTFPQLIHESIKGFGGVDMIDISGWAYSSTTGRVGDYTKYELGGKDNLRQGITQSHRMGVNVGLYLEGYLIDPRSTIGQKSGTDWQIINSDGSPKTWTGNEEIFICPYAPGWQDFMGKTLLQVAKDTQADALYMDQYGFGNAGKTCYASNHGHKPGSHPVRGEHEMLRFVRSKLNQMDHPVALYTEQVPNDITSQYTDAAFDYSMAGTRSYSNPTKLNLFRFAVPDFKAIELFHPGIDPKGISEEDAKLCLFHGTAMWLKGRAKSWYSQEFREFLHKAYSFFHEHEDAFTSTSVEPLIPTAQAGLFANRFIGKKETIVTLYNASHHTRTGLLLTIPESSAHSTINSFGSGELKIKRNNNSTLVEGFLHPHQLVCITLYQ